MTSTIDTQSLESLLERVRAATGPDRELDAEIMFDLFAKPVGRKGDDGPSGYLWPEDNPSWSFGIRFPGKGRDWFKKNRAKNDGETLLIERDGALVLMNQLRIPKLSSSLDACAALQAEVLPNCGRVVHAADTYSAIRVELFKWNSITAVSEGIHANECLAWLSAILSALIAKGETV